jgi:hypothetical protein
MAELAGNEYISLQERIVELNAELRELDIKERELTKEKIVPIPKGEKR